MSRVIVMLGPPGSGKGTQADIVCKEWSMRRISTGDILREAARGGTPLGLQARSIMEKGGLVPDEIIIRLVGEQLASRTSAGGFVLDGFPRTVAQAEALDRMLGEFGLKLTAVVNISVPDQELVRRLSGRRVCERCGANFHVAFNAPRREGKCDFCGGRLYRRDDDSPDTVRRRLAVYREQTRPLVDRYAARGFLRTVDGAGPPERVFAQIRGVLERERG